ncbi:MAG: diphosphatase, partial [Solirubrobacteraceae bacterium]|nr:diphosphatase [Solirubrobacteraceae bacterium]
CGLVVYPRLSPAVIVLVTRGADDGEALLVWGRRWEEPFYSTIAGFVEPGETLEHAVVREVREETGIEVSDVSYFASQPWPFPNQLMLGFRARYAAGEIAVQENEVREARWVTPAQLDELRVSRGSLSISGWLIEGWAASRAQ